jgi:anti-sigma regulatory factor (Ser/Thr protein kinase)
MGSTAAETDLRLIAFMLPSIPASVPIARLRIRAALGLHGLGEYADDAEIITSELVANAIQHVRGDGTETIGVTLARMRSPESVSVVVTDCSSEGPIKLEPLASSEQGRGMLIVDQLSARWGWCLKHGGKAVYAILARKTGA